MNIAETLKALHEDATRKEKLFKKAVDVIHAMAYVSGYLDRCDYDRSNPKDLEVLAFRLSLSKLAKDFWDECERLQIDSSEIVDVQFGTDIFSNILDEVKKGTTR